MKTNSVLSLPDPVAEIQGISKALFVIDCTLWPDDRAEKVNLRPTETEKTLFSVTANNKKLERWHWSVMPALKKQLPLNNGTLFEQKEKPARSKESHTRRCLSPSCQVFCFGPIATKPFRTSVSFCFVWR